MRKRKPIAIGKCDVSLERIAAPDCDGGQENCTIDVTHRIWLDMRNAGQQCEIGCYCEPCATEIAKALRDSLPETNE